jgi:two-component system, OmpR family, phosphate regulon response regulator PhoB
MVPSMSASRRPPSVLLVDDDEHIRAFVRPRLEARNIEVTEASSGEEALQILDDSFDLVILDIGLPGIDGFTVVRAIRERLSIPIIVVSGQDEEADRVLGLEIGADDYVVKPFLPRELVARVQVQLRRAAERAERAATPAPEQPIGFDDIVLDGTAMEARRDGEVLPLTNKEFDLLLFFASSPRQAFSRDQLLRQVWQTEPGWQDPATVTEHVHRLRRIIEDDPANPRHLVTVRGVGYRFDP